MNDKDEWLRKIANDAGIVAYCQGHMRECDFIAAFAKAVAEDCRSLVRSHDPAGYHSDVDHACQSIISRYHLNNTAASGGE